MDLGYIRWKGEGVNKGTTKQQEDKHANILNNWSPYINQQPKIEIFCWLIRCLFDACLQNQWVYYIYSIILNMVMVMIKVHLLDEVHDSTKPGHFLICYHDPFRCIIVPVSCHFFFIYATMANCPTLTGRLKSWYMNSIEIWKIIKRYLCPCSDIICRVWMVSFKCLVWMLKGLLCLKDIKSVWLPNLFPEIHI